MTNIRQLNAAINTAMKQQGFAAKWKFGLVGTIVALSADRDATVREADAAKRWAMANISDAIDTKRMAPAIGPDCFEGNTVINFAAR